MEYKHVKDIDFKSNINNRVFGIFLARDVEVKLQRDGVTKYISLNLCDKDFKIDAKKFSASEQDIETMKNGGVYCAAIDIKPYAKSPCGYSCTLYNFDTFDENPSNFITWAKGMDKANEVIQNALVEVSKSIYKDIVYSIMTQYWNEFFVWAAATGMHHNILGGLLVHTAEVVEQSNILAEYWNKQYGDNFINKSLLISGALLHDIAKIKELNIDKATGNIEYSTQSSLETHITMCISIIDITAYKLNFGNQTYNSETNEPLKTDEQIEKEVEALSLLKHIILAHHGKLEWGSCINMNIPEAFILNKADELSAAMYRFERVFNEMDTKESSHEWINGNISVTYKDSTK